MNTINNSGLVPGDDDLAETEFGALSALTQPVFDAEEYRADLADLNLTTAQETELLETLWSIMGTFARLGFEEDVCGLIFDEFNTVSAHESGDGKLVASTKMETPSNDRGDGGIA